MQFALNFSNVTIDLADTTNDWSVYASLIGNDTNANNEVGTALNA